MAEETVLWKYKGDATAPIKTSAVNPAWPHCVIVNLDARVSCATYRVSDARELLAQMETTLATVCIAKEEARRKYKQFVAEQATAAPSECVCGGNTGRICLYGAGKQE